MKSANSHSDAFIHVCSHQDYERGSKNRGKNGPLLVAKSDHRHQSVTSSSPLCLFQQYQPIDGDAFYPHLGRKGYHHSFNKRYGLGAQIIFKNPQYITFFARENGAPLSYMF